MPTLPSLHGWRARPLHELVAVALLARAEVVPGAAGAAGAADVDDHVHVAALHEVVVRAADDAAAAVVGRDRDDDREASGRVGTMNDRVQDDAVRHRDRNVRLLDDAVLGGPVVGRPARSCGGRSRDAGSIAKQEQRKSREAKQTPHWSASLLAPSQVLKRAPPHRPRPHALLAAGVFLLLGLS